MGESSDLSFPSGLSYPALSESPSTDPHWPAQGHLLTPEPLDVTLSSQPDSCYPTHPKSDLRLRWDWVGETWFAKEILVLLGSETLVYLPTATQLVRMQARI